MHASPPSLDAEIKIGVRLKHARLTRGISLKKLSEQVGCTESFLSKLENNKVRPSLSMLHRIVVALDINIATLFSENDPTVGPVAVMRPSDRPTIATDAMRHGPGITLERLVSNALPQLLEANIHHVKPFGSSDGPIQHDGEEIGYVLEGSLELNVDNHLYRLEKGDSFFFRSSLPHSYRNPSAQEATILWVNTPKSF